MPASQAQPTALFLPAQAVVITPSTTYRRLKTFVGVMMSRRLQASSNAVRHYEGLGWCDTTEQQVINGIATCRRN